MHNACVFGYVCNYAEMLKCALNYVLRNSVLSQ